MIAFQQNEITVFQSALFQTTSTVVECGDFVLVADPNWLPQEVEEIAAFVSQVRAGRALYLLFTHSDFDHILGYGAFPDATTIASREFVGNPNKERSVQAIRAWDSEYYVERPYDIQYPEISLAVSDRQTVEIGGTRLSFYSAPGHNPDGLFTVIEPHGVLLAGDYVSDIEFPYIYQSSTAYENTLAKFSDLVERHQIATLVPGHGRVTTDRNEMRRRRDDSLTYIQELKTLVAAGDQAAIDAMLTSYTFPLGMKSFHEGNVKLMRQELTVGKILE